MRVAAAAAPRWAPRSARPTRTWSRTRTSTAASSGSTLTAEELAAADAVVLLADHDEFDFDDIVGHAGFILDCRRRLEGPHVEYL